MKYSPKVNETLVRSTKVASLHPFQEETTVQGALEIIYGLDEFLREISGMNCFSFQPGGGSAAILSMASIIYAYHRHRGEVDKRDEIITTIFSHPSDAAAAAVKGFKIITLYPDEDGLPDLEADIADYIQRIVPEDHPYRHARFLHSDGQMAINAPSHLRGALLGFEAFFPIEDGKMVCGGRQTIYFVELDGPQERTYIIHIMGE